MYNQQTTLPNGIAHLTFGYFYNQSTQFPDIGKNYEN